MKSMRKTFTSVALAGCLTAGAASAAFAATSYVGGGVWDQGMTSTTTYSNYYHGSKAHSATAQSWNGTSRQLASPGQWARASVERSWGGNQTFWNAW